MVRPPLPETPPSEVEMQIIDLRVVDAAYLTACSKESTFRPPAHWKTHTKTQLSTDPNTEPRVLLFGTTVQGWSASIIVDGFRPYFDIEFPQEITGRDGTTISLTKPLMIDALSSCLDHHNPDDITGFSRRAYRVWGFKCDHEGTARKYRWLRMRCRTRGIWNKCLRFAKSKGYINALFRESGVYDTRERPLTVAADRLTMEQMFTNTTFLVPSGWTSVRGRVSNNVALQTQLVIRANMADVEVSERSDIAPLVYASFDIECVPKTGTRFPHAHRTTDQLAQIGVSLGIFGRGVVHRVVICLGDTAPAALEDGTSIEIISCETERVVLQEFRDLVVRVQPDVIMGYNIFKFDIQYIADRGMRIEAFGSYTSFQEVERLWRDVRSAYEQYEVEKEIFDEQDEKLKNNAAMVAALNRCSFVKIRAPRNRDDLPDVPYRMRLLADYDTLEELQEAYDYFHPMGRDLGFTFNWCARLRERVNLNVVLLQSAAFGSQELFRFDMTGICVLDLYLYIKTNFSMGNYSLKSVCNKFIPGQNKVDLPYDEMFRKYQSGDPVERSIVAVYCSMDCDLCIILCESKAAFVSNIVEMSRVCYTSMPDIVTRGQQIKVYSQVARNAEEMGFAMNFVDIPPPATYKGATVLVPTPGYYKHPIATLDFASLYPSIMQSHNLCYSTWIDPKDRNRMLDLQRRGKIKLEATKTATGVHFFVHPDSFKGLLPVVLNNTLGARRAVKKLMKKEPDKAKKALLNSRQLALKVSCNSTYGFTGVKKGRMPCYPIANVTTTIGRGMIDATKEAVESQYDATVIYGDSVAPWTPMVLRIGGEVVVLRVDTFASSLVFSEAHGGKESCELEDVDVLTADGWRPTARIIRHKCEKPIVRVNTDIGWIDVTEDHSLITCDEQPIPPMEVIPKETLLLGSPLHLCKPRRRVEHEDIRIPVVRMRMRRESAPRTLDVTVKRDIFTARLMASALVNTADDRLAFPTNDLTRVEIKYAAFHNHPEYEWKHEHEFLVASSSPAFFQTMSPIRSMYQDETLHYPLYLVNGGSKEEIQEYCRTLNAFMPLRVPDPVTALWIRVVYARMGDTVVSIQQDGFIYMKSCSGPRALYSSVRAISVNRRTDLPNGDIFVYDFTVPGKEQFDANGILVHNTDSVMVRFNGCPPTKEGMKQAFALGTEAADYVTNVTFQEHKEKVLEMEKASFPYILFKKKRYLAYVYEDPDKPGKHDFKGIELVRRDNSGYLRDIYQSCVDSIMPKEGLDVPPDACCIAEQINGIVQRHIDLLLSDQVPRDKFVISKSLKKKYKNQSVPQLILANKLRKRIYDGELVAVPPTAGDRIPYVVTEGEEKVCHRVEDPDWFDSHGMFICKEYYLENQIRNPMRQLLAPFSECPQGHTTKTIKWSKKELGGRKVEGWWDPDKKPVALYGNQCSACGELLKKKCEYCKICDWGVCPKCDIFVDKRLDSAIERVRAERVPRLAEAKRKKMGIQRIDKWFAPANASSSSEQPTSPVITVLHAAPEQKRSAPVKRKRKKKKKDAAPVKKAKGGLLRFVKK